MTGSRSPVVGVHLVINIPLLRRSQTREDNGDHGHISGLVRWYAAGAGSRNKIATFLSVDSPLGRGHRHVVYKSYNGLHRIEIGRLFICWMSQISFLTKSAYMLGCVMLRRRKVTTCDYHKQNALFLDEPIEVLHSAVVNARSAVTAPD